MTSLGSMRILAAVAGVAAVVAAVAGLAGQAGCGSDCASDCPPATVYIGNVDGQQLAIDEILVNGPACPSSSGVYCIGDGPGSNCTHFTITGTTEWVCDVLIVFHDRRGHKGLHILKRQPPYGLVTLAGNGFQADLSRDKENQKKGIIVATRKLTDENWQPLEPGSMIVATGGEIAWKSGD